MRKFLIFPVAFFLIFPFWAQAQTIWSKTVEESFSADRDELMRVRIILDAGSLKVTSSNSRTRGNATIHYYRRGLNALVNFDQERNRLTVQLESDKFEFLKRDEKSDKWGEITILLPYDVHIDLNAKVKAGDIDFDLGGMHITDVSLNNWAGAVNVDFSDENQEIMHSFEVTSSFGEVKLHNLGNAKFEKAEINCGIGDLVIDFSGTHLHGSYANIDLDVGKTTITIPQYLGIKLALEKAWLLSHTNLHGLFSKKGRYYYSKSYDEDGETLFLSISPGFGELQITAR